MDDQTPEGYFHAVAGDISGEGMAELMRRIVTWILVIALIFCLKAGNLDIAINPCIDIAIWLLIVLINWDELNKEPDKEKPFERWHPPRE